MKIGIDARCLCSTNLRGIGKYVFNLISNCIKLDRSCEFVLFLDSRYKINENLFSIPRVKIRKFFLKGDRFFFWEQLRLPLEITRSGIELMHSPANTLPVIQFKPAILTLHDTLLMESDEDETNNFLFYTRKIIPLGLKRAKKIVTVSQNSKKDIMRYFNLPEEKIVVIYHGVDPSFKKIEHEGSIAEVKIKYGIKKKYILSLGARGSRKNTKKILDVFSLLKRHNKIEHQLVISGLQDDAFENFYNYVKKFGLCGEVILAKYIPENDLIHLYNGAELFLYLPLYEGFGFPVLEAMACGCAVVASNTSSLPEICGDSACLVDPYDLEDICNKTHSLLMNEQLRENFKRSGIIRARLFDWEKSAAEILKVYQEVLSN